MGTPGTSHDLVISVVSHGHGAMIGDLLQGLSRCSEPDFTVVLTRNLPEADGFSRSSLPFPLVEIVNEAPQGFGANHNAAFRRLKSRYFCVLNPDIRVHDNPFPSLIETLNQPGIGLVAPRIVGPGGESQDSARRFLSPWELARRILFRASRRGPERMGEKPDWVAGMFMLFRSETYDRLSGFDPRYFMYCEDADICVRLRRLGLGIALVPEVQAIHDARRASHRSFRHLYWHVKSLLRFMMTHPRPPSFPPVRTLPTTR